MGKGKRKIEKVLILRTDHIGEVLLSTVVVDAIKSNYPEAYVAFGTSSLAKQVVEAKEGIDEILVFETLGERCLWPKMFGWYKQVAFKGFDLVVVLNANKFLHLLVFIAGIKIRIGYNRKWPFFLTDTVFDRKSEGQKHEADYNLEMLKAIGIYEKNLLPSLQVSQFDQRNVKELLSEKSVDLKKKIVVVQPGSSKIQKCWPREYYIELINNILSEYDVNIILSGSATEFGLCDYILKNIDGRVFNFAGSFSLKQLIALLGVADLMVTNDSGPMHISAALGKKVIGIFRGDNKGLGPNRWGPLGRNSIVFFKPEECEQCFDADCPHKFRCLKAIKPNEIFESIRKNKLI